MKSYNVKCNYTENGKDFEEKIFYLDVRGKNLDKITLEKRLINNLKTLQSIWRRNVNPLIKIEMISYEER